jgi:spore coat polysaccharide biosynthesis protein SpsF
VSNTVAAIVQARMGSTRLPGKSLMPLAGVPLAGRVLERIKTATRIDKLVLAIPDTSENDSLEKLAQDYGVSVFRGSEIDLVDRYYNAAKNLSCKYVVRIPADNPVPQASEIDRIIDHHLSLNRPGFSSNLAQVYGSKYPDGIGAEIFDFELLEEAFEDFSDSSKREHVHLNFFNYATQKAVDEKWCPISTVNCPSDFARPDIILDVNTQDQFEYMANLYKDLYPSNPNFDIKDIINWHDKNYKQTDRGYESNER